MGALGFFEPRTGRPPNFRYPSRTPQSLIASLASASALIHPITREKESRLLIDQGDWQLAVAAGEAPAISLEMIQFVCNPDYMEEEGQGIQDGRGHPGLLSRSQFTLLATPDLGAKALLRKVASEIVDVGNGQDGRCLGDQTGRAAAWTDFIRLLVLVLLSLDLASAEWEMVRPTIDFNRSGFASAEQAERVKECNSLAGYTGNAWKPVSGWVEYDVEIAQGGWHQWIIPAKVWGMEYFVDGQLLPNSGGGLISNLWLDSGKHVFRVQSWKWTGFEAKFDAWILRAATRRGMAARLRLADGRSIVRAGEPARLVVQIGGSPIAGKAGLQLVSAADRTVVTTVDLAVPADTAKPVELAVELICPAEGSYQVFLTLDGTAVPPTDLTPFDILAIDTAPPRRGGELKRTLLREIDCAATTPAYSGLDGTRLVESAIGKYREGGSVGFLAAQHHNRDCGWFAYPLAVPESGKPYIIETDSPDNAFRTFAIVIRESQPGAYPVAGGLDTGGCFSQSGRLQTHSLLFWPRTTDLRVVFVTAHDGRAGAAVSKIRLYRIDGELPVPDLPDSTRTFANWYEEGHNYLSMYGVNHDLPGTILGSERWARTVASMGGNMLMPTVSVYQMGMYPSNFNTAFSSSGTFDSVRVLAMKCEKYGLGLVGEFHPECRDLERLGDPACMGRPRPNRMANKDGHVGETWGEVPRYHPLNRINQDWYVGMIGEFVDRYKDSPAFKGVNLRLMGWANPALNNFHSLDWGYDDLTVSLFEQETGLSTGAKADDPARFQARYSWLMANARDQWIAWRCQKIAAIYTRVRDRVRQARPDLRIWSTTTDLGLDAGIDPRLLGAIDGVTLINARHGYGRQAFTYHGPLADHRNRDQLIDPTKLLAMCPKVGGGAFLFGQRYFEATESVVTPEELGYPKGTRRTWFSAAITPSGRLFLERYALALAACDAFYLSDGGNTYTIGQPVLREFMQEFRHLPALPFRIRAEDPVTVRELARPQDFLFYAVNRERFPATVAVTLIGATQLIRLGTGAKLPLTDGKLLLKLQPYELAVLQAPAGSAITSVATIVAPTDRAPAEAMVTAAQDLADQVGAGRIKLDANAKELLLTAVAEAKLAIGEGRLWWARSVLEDSALAERVYNPTGIFPTGLEFLAYPSKPAKPRENR